MKSPLLAPLGRLGPRSPSLHSGWRLRSVFCQTQQPLRRVMTGSSLTFIPKRQWPTSPCRRDISISDADEVRVESPILINDRRIRTNAQDDRNGWLRPCTYKPADDATRASSARLLGRSARNANPKSLDEAGNAAQVHIKLVARAKRRKPLWFSGPKILNAFGMKMPALGKPKLA